MADDCPQGRRHHARRGVEQRGGGAPNHQSGDVRADQSHDGTADGFDTARTPSSRKYVLVARLPCKCCSADLKYADSSARARSAPPHLYEPDIAFVGPSRDSTNGQWYYQVGLLGFPADTVVEISGYDTYGNVQVAPLVMTTAEGSWNPFTAGFGSSFSYGGTCDDAKPTTVTARGKGFSVSETAPRPLECDGGATQDGPWTRPTYPKPAPAPATPPTTSGFGGA